MESAPLVGSRPADGRSPALVVVAVYYLLGSLWILLGDRFLAEYQTLKGLVFVALTGALLGVIVARSWKRSAALDTKHQQLQRLEAVGRLAGGIAHDFNNLLAVIGGYTDLALKDSELSDELREDLERVREAADKARALNRQILAFSRRQPMEMTTVDLNSLVRSTVKLARGAMPDTSIEVRLDEDLPPITADPGQIEQVVMNLLMNARDALQAGDRIRVETAELPVAKADRPPTPVPMRSDIYARIRVSDDGHGMDDATLRRVFEPFFTTKEEGTGLGLATCYGIVKRHGGYIWASSEPGEGTTFDVYLPLTEVAESKELRAAS